MIKPADYNAIDEPGITRMLTFNPPFEELSVASAITQSPDARSIPPFKFWILNQSSALPVRLRPIHGI